MGHNLLKSRLAGLCHWMGADRLLGAVTGSGEVPLVLGYHRVVEQFGAHSARTMPAMLVSRRMLERHLDWVALHYRLVSLDELGSRLDSGAPAAGMAAVTFDDGYRDVYEHALPLLKRKGIPAAVFVVTDLVGTSALQLHDRLYLLLDRTVTRERDHPRRLAQLFREIDVPLPEPERSGRGRADPVALTVLLLARLSQAEVYRVVARLEEGGPLAGDEVEALRPLTWEMLSEMQRNDVTVGSHTKRHALLTSEDVGKRTEETTASREVLQRRLGIEVRHFAYPGGCFDGESVEAVRAAGYRFGYTACRHRDPRHPLLTIPRTLLWERSSMDAAGRFSPALLSCLANGLLPLASRCRAHHGQRANGPSAKERVS
jgi:peptidoglycan/xylan/chitin deacetylase (PgdA/CDA1 family)